MKANAVNLATFTNTLCHLNATLSCVAVLAPCAWGENLVARQIRLGKCGEMGGICEQNKAWRHYKFSTEKMGQCLGGGLLSLSLSLSLLALFGTPLG